MPVPGGAVELAPRRPLRGLGARDPCAGRRRGGGRGRPSGTTAGLGTCSCAPSRRPGGLPTTLAPGARGHRRDQPPGGARIHIHHARPRRQEMRTARPTEMTGHCAPHVRPDLRPTAATGVTARDMSGPLSSGVPGKMPQATRTAGCSRVTRLFSRATDGVTAEGARGTRARQGPPRVRTGPARRPRRCATPADGRQQRRRNRCPAGYPAGRRIRTPLRREVARTARERGSSDHLDGKPAKMPTSRGQTRPWQPVKRAAKGPRNVEYHDTAIFPGLRPVVRRPRLRSVLARAIHQKPEEPFF